MPAMRPRLRLLSLITGLVLAGCASNPFSDTLSYGQAQTLNPGLTADWVLAEYPFGTVTRGQGNRVESIRYTVRDPHGSTQTLVLFFDAQGILRRRQYSGRVLRPEAP
ncbi:MAG: hypothetical protein ACYTG6_11935 [Planctomycetota bacterium]|jgi:hypothetical protein